MPHDMSVAKLHIVVVAMINDVYCALASCPSPSVFNSFLFSPLLCTRMTARSLSSHTDNQHFKLHQLCQHASCRMSMVVRTACYGILPVLIPHDIATAIDACGHVAHCCDHHHYHDYCCEDIQECKNAAGQETSQQAAANQPQHAKAGSKKKQRGGKKAAAKGGKGARTASGSMAQAADSDEEATVEFFVPADENEADFELIGEYPVCCPYRQQVFHFLALKLTCQHVAAITSCDAI